MAFMSVLMVIKLFREVNKRMNERNKQTEANKKWQQNNRERARYLRDRSTSRSFIRNKAQIEDLEELTEIMKEREKVLKYKK